VRKAFKTVWGLKCPSSQRGKLLYKLADLIEENADELAALEALDNGEWMLMFNDFLISG
jgi:aldehyde dehydrogenase (NAD+)